jgi:addiction module HigA family antidote
MATEPASYWHPDWAVRPGEVLLEALEERGMTQAELARRGNRPLKTINEIAKGKTAITPETAIQFELILGIPARFWNNLQRNYSEVLAAADEKKRLESFGAWFGRFPVGPAVKRGWLAKTNSRSAAVAELLRFFGVSSPEAWERQSTAIQAAFRQSPAFVSSPEATALWLRWGEIQAKQIDCRPFDAAALRAALPRLRELTRLDAFAFVPELTELLARCGVALIVANELPGIHISGAARWLNAEKALIQLSLRHRSDDQFWFALFHEIGHLLRSGRRQDHLDIPANGRGVSEEEGAADSFARDHLIPPAGYRRVEALGDINASNLRALAKQLGVSPGILVGRLQADGRLTPAQFTFLKRPLRWPEEAQR